MRHFLSWLRALLSLAGVLIAASAFAADKVRIGVTMSTADTPLFVALARGYFTRENLDVEVLPFDSASRAIAPLATGDLDVAGGSPSAGLFNAADRKIDIRIVANRSSAEPGYHYQSVVIRTDHMTSGRFRGYKDLKGLKIGIPAPGTGGQILIDEMARLGGLAYGDIEQVFLGFPQLVVALQNKAVDGALMIEPYATAVVTAKTGVKFAPTEDFYPKQEVSLLFYGDKFARERADVGRRFMKGWLRGARDYNDVVPNGAWSKDAGAEDVIAIMSKAIGMKPEQIRDAPPQFTHPDGAINLASLRKDLAFYKDKGLVESKTVTADAIVDMSFVEAAVRELGPYARKR